MKLKALGLTAALAALPFGAMAQDFPNRDVTIVVPYSPAGSTDPVARFIGGELQKMWGVNVLIESKPGAGATIGTAYVATQPADGYTVLLTTPAYTTAPSVYKDLPYDPLNDLVPVAQTGFTQFVVAAGPSVKSDTLEGFIEEAQSRQIFMSTSGLGSSGHFVSELFARAAGLPDAIPVHYKGGSPAQVDVIGGRADTYVGSVLAVLGNVEAGKMKPLVVLGNTPAAKFPDTPTAAEAGIDADVTFWWGVFAPAGTPDDIVKKIHDDMMTVLESDVGQEYLASNSAALNNLSVEEFQDFIKKDLEEWKKLAEERGIEAN
ncbi:hypothetical protein ATO6_16425 [Oceanicola sp. 22II-s10i]|uniref:Bug family tripartite tricarboxylate transporter substrate binding protein n=1 Tax=Oceanicola sp. 22II-s10i TaxID=1317116 RepID=UPI000B522A17|nr:tripartite tricarboxylate transporter substrate binding protein [Oceanicola sp. 22II-s10i]OWU83985.1 hypothetical protein ATO6_16425 [Oceanicola sp. 22II-s10i]